MENKDKKSKINEKKEQKLAKKRERAKAKQERSYDFIKHRMLFLFIPLIIIAITIGASFYVGVNVDIKFKGGTIINVPYSGDINLDEARQVTETSLNESCTVQKGENETSTQLVITLSENKELSPQQTNTLVNDLKNKFEDNLKDTTADKVEVTSVNPQIGSDFFKKSMVAVAVAFIAIVIYIGIRFRKIGGFSAGIMGLIALFHDIAFVFAAIVYFRFPINDAFMAIVLTILGYSINNTIVIYDRIRENRNALSGEKSIREIVNLSINQTLSRSINTTLTTILALIVMLIVALITHINTIVSFVVPLIFGMVAGAYSSIFISGPLWVWWKEKHPGKEKTKRKKHTKKEYIETDPALSIPEEIDVKTSFKINKKALNTEDVSSEEDE